MTYWSSKIAVVTGAGSGIGRAVCALLSARCSNVIAVDISTKQLNDLAVKDENKLVANVSVKEQVEKVYGDVISRFQRPPEILINSAGIIRDNFLLKIPESDWNEVVDVNLKGTFLMTQVHALTWVKFLKGTANNQTSGLTGSIVNISSISAKGNPGQANYSASKAGVIGLTKTSAMELARYGIRVNCVLPGFINTPMTQSVPGSILEKLTKQIPLQRTGTPEEVANLIAFLASDESSYITGAAIDVDGGLRM